MDYLSIAFICSIVYVVCSALAQWAIDQYNSGNNDGAWEILYVLFMVIPIVTSFGCMIYLDSKPTAIEVYQGKTELEYTITSSGAVKDSTVIYKPELELNH